MTNTTKQAPQIDFSDLQDEVKNHWEEEGIEYFTTENVGFSAPDPEKIESTIKPDYAAILDDPIACIAELGFVNKQGQADLSLYVAAHAEPIEPAGERKAIKSERRFPAEEVGVTLGYGLISKIRTKFFFEKDGKEIEFYIDRDPKTSTACLWIRSGYTEGGYQLMIALLNELDRAVEHE